MAFKEEVEVLLVTKSHVVEHIKGVEIEIVSDKLVYKWDINGLWIDWFRA